jgi:hypothetical protein
MPAVDEHQIEPHPGLEAVNSGTVTRESPQRWACDGREPLVDLLLTGLSSRGVTVESPADTIA